MNYPPPPRFGDDGVGGGPCFHLFTDDGRLEIDEDGPRHVLARRGLAEEGVEGLVGHLRGRLLGREVAVGLDAVLQAVQLPACIADLTSGLTHVD